MHLVLSHPVDGGALSPCQREGIVSALEGLPHDIRAVLIRWDGDAKGGTFGPDQPHPEDLRAPDLAAVCHAIEGCPQPVFVLLGGPVAGAAAEMALAAHGRIAVPKTRLLFAQMRLGMIPNCGTTQLLPRLVGAAEALRLLRGAQGIPAAEALAMGLIDHVVEGDDAPSEAALAWIDGALAEAGKPLSSIARGTGFRDGRAYLAAVAAARAEVDAGDSVDKALIDCVEAAMLLPVQQGMEFERSLAADLAASPRAAALCHIHRAELRAEQMPEGLRAFAPAPVRRLGILGAAPAFSGLVLTALSRGVAVSLVETDRAKLVAMLQTIASRQEAAVASGRLSAAQRDADWARLAAVADPSALEAADMVLIAPECEMPLPQIAALIAHRKGRAVLLAGRGEVPNGAFRLILTGRVAEIALPQGAAAQPAVQAIAFLRRMGMTVVPVGDQNPAGIAGRLAVAAAASLRALLAMGVPAPAISAALMTFGLKSPTLVPPDGVTPRDMPQAEIVSRWLGALANEGARLLQAGLALSPLDVDLVAVAGMGFPRDKGGPLHQSDQRGLLVVRRDLIQWSADAEVWKPMPAWDAFVSVGRGFAGSLSPR